MIFTASNAYFDKTRVVYGT